MFLKGNGKWRIYNEENVENEHHDAVTPLL